MLREVILTNEERKHLCSDADARSESDACGDGDVNVAAGPLFDSSASLLVDGAAASM